MMKWLTILVLAGLMGASWMYFNNKGQEVQVMRDKITQLEENGDPDELVPEMKTQADGLDNEKTFSGILLTFLSAGFLGIFFVVYLLPFFAQRVTHAVYDSAEMVEKDVMHDARSLLAQGDYEGAINAFKAAAAAEPLNRLPWVEIAKIYKDNLGDPGAAIGTIRHALESQAWEINDAAYFLFRLAELYDEVEGNRESAIAIMNQVIEQFPNTRHSANASHRLHEWSTQAGETGTAAEETAATPAAPAGEGHVYVVPGHDDSELAAEEEEFLARMRAAEQARNPGAGDHPA